MGSVLVFIELILQRRRQLVLAIVFAALSAGGLGAGLLGIKPILDNVLGKHRNLPSLAQEVNEKLNGWATIPQGLIDALPTSPYSAVVWMVVGLGALTMLGATANFLHQYYALTIVIETIAELRERAFNRILHSPMRQLYGQAPRSGPSDAISRISFDTQVVALGLGALLSKSLAQVSKGVAALIAALVLDWRVTLVVLSVTPVLAFILRKLGKRIHRAARAALVQQSGLYQAAGEALAGLRVVKVHTTEDSETRRFADLSQEMARQEKRIRTTRSLASPIIETIVLVVIGAMVLVSAKAILDNQIDSGSFILVLGCLGVAGGSMRPLTGLLNDIQHSSAAVERLQQLLAFPVEQPADAKLPALPRHSRSLRFERVSLTYPGGAQPAVRDVSLDIPHGSTVAFVGPNGSGKTSLLALVPRLFDPDQPPQGGGRVLIDGVDIKSVDLRSLRAQIGVVTQDTVLFQGTIRTNIAYGSPGADEQAVRDAARRARAEEFILAKGRGYDEPIGEGGTGLSGGQKQRLAIARAILRDPAILILDEATSMIDAHSEALIAEAIDEFVSVEHSRRTCLIVAHRLSTVLHADKIVVMDQGRLVDQGTHHELMARCAVYRTIAQRQLFGDRPDNTPTTPSTPATTINAGQPSA
jgi:ABC-type multidrug transport system fused ATPase/permease subunit